MKVGPVHSASSRPPAFERIEQRRRDHEREADAAREKSPPPRPEPRPGTGRLVDRTA